MVAHYHRFILCEGKDGNCATPFPVTKTHPAAAYPTVNYDSMKVVREAAANSGWEVRHGKAGRDLCPACRIQEIRSQSGLDTGE